jgi:signal transduction histidine kinase
MRRRGRLVRKYLAIMVALVTGALLVSGAVQIYYAYNESKAALVALQREKAGSAASKIENYVREIERQLVWTTQPLLVPAAAAIEQRRLDAGRLQRQVLAITEVSHLDATGHEQLQVSRLKMDVIGSRVDYSNDPKFKVPRSGRTYFGPVYFRKGSEPYMTIAMPQAGGGVTAAEVNLKFIWDVVSQIKVGKAGLAYVVDGGGALIAHPDISLVLQNRNLAGLAQVKAVLADVPGDAEVTIAKDLKGRDVLTAHARIATLGWVVLVEQPLEEAFAPLRASAYRTVVLVALGIVLAAVASVVLARRLARPIQALQASAATIGAGALDHQISIRTGDELEALADEFNRMTGRLRESYANLEQKVEDRTRELSEALEQQTATSDILGVISRSPTEVGPVLAAVAESAARLCTAVDAMILRVEGPMMRRVAHFGDIASVSDVRSVTRDTPSGRAIVERQTIHIEDILEECARGEYLEARALQEGSGFRTVLVVPLMREGVVIGVINIRRLEVRAFTAKQIALVKTFADQAVIAIENVRLFKELEEKNRVVTAALEQQTATAEVLRVISSSPTEVRPVFDMIIDSAIRLMHAKFGGVYRFDGTVIDLATARGWGPEVMELNRRSFPMPPGGGSLIAQAIRDKRVVQVVDSEADPALPQMFVDSQRLLGTRSCIAVPMFREGLPVGGIVVAREEAAPFPDEQLALLQTFADQAVIAIENVRLFTELEARNAALSESLEQQTGTGEILRVISSSPSDVQPVLDTVTETAARLCSALDAHIWRVEGGVLYPAASYGSHPIGLDARPLDRDVIPGRAILERRTIHIDDLAAVVETEFPAHKAAQARTGTRSILAVPLLREGLGIGVIVIRRTEVRPFTEKQVALLQTFADQAVIAIENVRLFKELQARTADLTRSVGELEALGEVSRAISSTLDLEVVLATIVSRANELAETDGCAIFEFDEATRAFRLRATERYPDEFVAALRATSLVYGEGAIGRAAATREPVQVPDVADTDVYSSRVRDTLMRAGYRSLLAVPLVSEDEVVGALVVNRREAGAFADRTVEMLRTFATQSALAIQNARLFSEIETKSHELQVANRHKDEFLASMSHELRTPLNAIIGFSEVMLERLFGDVNAKQEEYLNDILSSGRHLLSLINDILDLAKIEAGRMELEPADFDLPQAIDNALVLVRERAMRRGITLEQSIDPRLGEIKGDERKIKQVMLNLLSNAVKFTPEGGRIAVRAVLADGVAQVSVADTGVGIAPEDHAAVFEEFRQVGTDYARKHEGTGLGLALARKFVELHGGTIRVDSQLGRGATFTFTIPVTPWQAS